MMSEPTSEQKDYTNLTPDLILDAIESLGIVPDCSLLALNSYENRVYRFSDQNAQKQVIKVYRPQRWSKQQILEEHQFSQQLSDAELPIVCPSRFNHQSLHYFQGYWFSVFPNRGGRILDLEQSDQLQWLGRFIARIHNIGATQNYQSRIALSVENFATRNLPILEQCAQLPDALRTPYLTIFQQLLVLCEQGAKELGQHKQLRIHGDCHQGNVLWTDEGPHFVDFDDSITGPAVQDLWMLISGQGEDQLRQWDAILDGYQEFREFNTTELNCVELLRALRMMNYTAWLAKRWGDPSFKYNFPWFAEAQYWENQILLLKEQYALVQEPNKLATFF